MRLFARQPKTWAQSQRYELDHAIAFMKEPSFRQLHADWRAGKLNASTGHRDALMLQEFFGGDRQSFDQFFKNIAGKSCLDIGPCVFSPLSAWDVAGPRFAIEPLLSPIDEWQRTNLGESSYRDIKGFARPAEEFIRELRIDGAILCRNMLDHTPKWPFVLANISAYAAPGCKLLLWTDIDHGGEEDEGHYNITSDVSDFRNLVRQLGFRIVREYQSTGRPETNWGCFAERL
jgi:hypothetical protein